MARIGVMTTGGDCAGLNAAIRAVVARAAQDNAEVLGIKNGTAGLNVWTWNHGDVKASNK